MGSALTCTPQTVVEVSEPVRRTNSLGRLSRPEAFADLMRKRPIASNDWLMVYAQPSEQGLGSALGFIIPKKVLRRAVHRNKVRRWCRAYWQGHPLSLSHHLLVRCRGKPQWTTTHERQQRYGSLVIVFDQAYQILKGTS